VVQHQARDEMPDEWASGAMGYLKDDFVIGQMTAAGFEFAGMIAINFNAKDQPGEEDVVWRLPPTLMNSKDNAELKAAMLEIGESNRMTLKFRKP
jgi:predicted methyltransferase